jgi:hypothetical protein
MKALETYNAIVMVSTSKKKKKNLNVKNVKIFGHF